MNKTLSQLEADRTLHSEYLDIDSWSAAFHIAILNCQVDPAWHDVWNFERGLHIEYYEMIWHDLSNRSRHVPPSSTYVKYYIDFWCTLHCVFAGLRHPVNTCPPLSLRNITHSPSLASWNPSFLSIVMTGWGSWNNSSARFTVRPCEVRRQEASLEDRWATVDLKTSRWTHSSGLFGVEFLKPWVACEYLQSITNSSKSLAVT